MDKLQFHQACDAIINTNRPKNGIGTLGEKTLHAVLKRYFEPFEDSHERKVGGFVADIVGENGIIEIQTRNFDKLRKKLDTFLEAARVTVVYPIPQTKWLMWIDENGVCSNRRKSPKTGTIYDAFKELYKIKSYLNHPNFNLCIVLLEVEEYRYLNGWSKDKKKGSTRCDRIPIEICDEFYFEALQDFQKLIPSNLTENFTAKDYKKSAGVSLSTAQTALNILNYLGTVQRVDKKGNAYIYKKSPIT